MGATVMNISGLTDYSRLGPATARLTHTVGAGVWKVGSYLSLSLGHDALWPKIALSVSIEEGKLGVIYGSRILSRIRVRGVRRYAFEPDRYPQPDAVLESIRLACEEFRISPKDIALVVPREWVIARTIELPLTVAENLRGAVAFELDRFTPFVEENALYDFLPLREGEETIHLFLAACRADNIRPYIAALEAGSMRVERIATSLTATAIASSYITKRDTLLFVEVLDGAYSGGVMVDRRISGLFADSFNGEMPGIKAERIKEELSRISAAVSTAQDSVETVMVTDGSISQEVLKQHIPSATMLSDLDRRKLQLKESFPGLTLAELGSIIEPLWPKAQGVDLLAKGERKKRPSPMLFTIVLLVALAAMLLTYFVAPLTIERRRTEEMARQIALLKEPVRKVEALKKEVEAQEKENKIIEGFRSGQVRAMDVLREVTKILPKNAWLTRARITDKSVDLEGYASSASEVLPKLEASPLLKKVEFASPTFRDARLNADRFVIRMEIENENIPNVPDTGGSKNEVKK